MSQVCERCGKRPQTGHNVSYSQRKTKRRFEPNLQKHNGQKLCTRCIRTLTNKM